MLEDTLNAVTAQVAEVAGYLWEKGWAERNGGNISCDVSACAPLFSDVRPLTEPVPIGLSVPQLRGACFLVTGTGRRMRDVARDPMGHAAILRICEDAAHYEILAEAPVRPTSELPSHLAIHNWLRIHRPACKAVIHTHPTELVAMSHNPAFRERDVLTRILWSMIPETRAFCPKGLGIVPYTLPGSVALAENTLVQLADYDVVLWEKHGVLAVGPDPIEAFDMIDTLSKSAQIYLDACTMGFRPEGMSDAQMDELKQAFNL